MKIVGREQIELTTADREIISKVRRKKTLFMLKAYLALIVILLIIFLTALIKPAGASDETIQKYQRPAFILTLSGFLLFTSIFIIHYYRRIIPYSKDLKTGLKTVSWFYPVSYKTPFFEHFFLKTGSPKKPMLPITKVLYDSIQPGVLAYIVFAPASKFLLLLDINGHRIEYNEESFELDM